MASTLWNGSMPERIATTWFLFETFVATTWTGSFLSTHATNCWTNEQYSSCCCSSISGRILPTSVRIWIDGHATGSTARFLSSNHSNSQSIERFTSRCPSFVFNPFAIILIQSESTSQFQSFAKRFSSPATDCSTTFRRYHLSTLLVIFDTGFIQSNRFVGTSIERRWRFWCRYWNSPIDK